MPAVGLLRSRQKEVSVKKSKYILSIAAVVALFLNLIVFPTKAGALTFNPATGGTGANNDQSVGWQFNVLNSVTVTDLEWFDPTGNGLSTAHTVGIWNPAGALLT